MKRIEKLGEYAVKAFTLPIRVCVGVYKCIEKATPDTLEMPFEIKSKRKEDTNGSTETNDAR
jgi:hypothetical protein